jgi:hypothetical protein
MIWRSHFVHCVLARTSPVAVHSWSATRARDEAADVGEVVRQANLGHPAEGLEELLVGGDSNRAIPRGLEIVPSRVVPRAGAE